MSLPRVLIPFPGKSLGNVKRLKAQGITILVSTPYMDEATLCDKIALMQGGKILSVDTPHNIMVSYPGKLYAARAAKYVQAAPGPSTL
jgi:ABC-type multidrug transport system ATPase subunit